MWGLSHRPHPRQWEWFPPGAVPGGDRNDGLAGRADRLGGLWPFVRRWGPAHRAGVRGQPQQWSLSHGLRREVHDGLDRDPQPTRELLQGRGGLLPKDRCADQSRADLAEIRVRHGGRPVPRGHLAPQCPLHRGL